MGPPRRHGASFSGLQNSSAFVMAFAQQLPAPPDWEEQPLPPHGSQKDAQHLFWGCRGGVLNHEDTMRQSPPFDQHERTPPPDRTSRNKEAHETQRPTTEPDKNQYACSRPITHTSSKPSIATEIPP